MFKEMPREQLYALAREMFPCVGFHTRRATRLVTQHYDKALASAGVRSTQYSLLSVLSLQEETSMQELALVLGMDRTTLTRNLNPLVRKGWVKVAASEDRRARPLALTAKGRAALEKARPLWEATQAGIVAQVGAARWEQIMRGLHQISMLIEQMEDDK